MSSCSAETARLVAQPCPAQFPGQDFDVVSSHLPADLLPCYIADMGRADRITILLSVAALCVTIIGTSCSTNARIGDLSARIDGVNANVNARIDHLRAELTAQIAAVNASVNARIDDLRAELTAQIAAVNTRLDAVDRDVRELRAIVIDAVKATAHESD